jgi:hypothetical protein
MAGAACGRRSQDVIVVVPVPVNAGATVMPVSLWLSMVVEGNHGNRGVLLRARMSDLSVFSLSPGPARELGSRKGT